MASGSDGAVSSSIQDLSKSNLCLRCSQLNPEELFRKGKFKTRPGVRLGSLLRATENSTCDFCRLLGTLRVPCREHQRSPRYYLHKRAGAGIDGEGVLRSFFYDQRPVISARVVTCEEDCPDISHSWVIGAVDRRTGKAIGDSVPARGIEADSVDFAIILDWMAECDERHADHCRSDHSAIPWPSSLKLIDCHQRCVVRVDTVERYCALSYVWGPPVPGDRQKVGYDSLPAVLPQTIEDSLQVAKNLGFRYIWIDRYCINQEDPTERREQIRQMDLIYRKAMLTIIDAAGSGPGLGLPGMGTRPRHVQQAVAIRNFDMVPISIGIRNTILRSEWAGRAWTFQEAYFSSRKLIFTSQQIYFECRKGAACETINLPLVHSAGYPIFGIAEGQADGMEEILKLLQDYSRRRLTFQTDAVHAFEGVLHDFRCHQHRVDHYFGVLLVPFASKTARTDLFAGRHLQRRPQSRRLLAGLCWRHATAGHRRDAHPSWSWSGWTCELQAFHIDLEHDFDFHIDKSARIEVETLGGALLSFEDIYLAGDDSLLMSRYIVVEADVIAVKIQQAAALGLLDGQLLKKHAWLEAHTDGYWALIENAAWSMWFPIFLLNDSYRPNQVIPQQSAEQTVLKSQGILVGDWKRAHPKIFGSAFVLILSQEEHHSERVGYGILDDGQTIVLDKSTGEMGPAVERISVNQAKGSRGAKKRWRTRILHDEALDLLSGCIARERIRLG